MGIQPLLTLLVSLTTVAFSFPKVGGWNPFFFRGAGTTTTAAVDPKLVLLMEESMDTLVIPDAMDRSLIMLVFVVRTTLVKRGANPIEV